MIKSDVLIISKTVDWGENCTLFRAWSFVEHETACPRGRRGVSVEKQKDQRTGADRILSSLVDEMKIQ